MLEKELFGHIVTLSGAKGLVTRNEILRSAQNDTGLNSYQKRSKWGRRAKFKLSCVKGE